MLDRIKEFLEDNTETRIDLAFGIVMYKANNIGTEPITIPVFEGLTTKNKKLINVLIVLLYNFPIIECGRKESYPTFIHLVWNNQRIFVF